MTSRDKPGFMGDPHSKNSHRRFYRLFLLPQALSPAEPPTPPSCPTPFESRRVDSPLYPPLHPAILTRSLQDRATHFVRPMETQMRGPSAHSHQYLLDPLKACTATSGIPFFMVSSKPLDSLYRANSCS